MDSNLTERLHLATANHSKYSQWSIRYYASIIYLQLFDSIKWWGGVYDIMRVLFTYSYLVVSRGGGMEYMILCEYYLPAVIW